MAQVPRAKRPTKSKYTILVDRQIQDYQLHIKRNTNVNFSDLVRAAIYRLASDPQLEGELIGAIGGGYYDDDEPEPEPVPHSPATTPPLIDHPTSVAEDGEFWPGDA